MSDESDKTRRSILKGIGAGAMASIATVGAASAGDVGVEDHCHYEYRCNNINLRERRHCCEDPDTGETDCSSWTMTSTCCGTPCPQ